MSSSTSTPIFVPNSQEIAARISSLLMSVADIPLDDPLHLSVRVEIEKLYHPDVKPKVDSPMTIGTFLEDFEKADSMEKRFSVVEKAEKAGLFLSNNQNSCAPHQWTFLDFIKLANEKLFRGKEGFYPDKTLEKICGCKWNWRFTQHICQIISKIFMVGELKCDEKDLIETFGSDNFYGFQGRSDINMLVGLNEVIKNIIEFFPKFTAHFEALAISIQTIVDVLNDRRARIVEETKKFVESELAYDLKPDLMSGLVSQYGHQFILVPTGTGSFMSYPITVLSVLKPESIKLLDRETCGVKSISNVNNISQVLDPEALTKEDISQIDIFLSENYPLYYQAMKIRMNHGDETPPKLKISPKILIRSHPEDQTRWLKSYRIRRLGKPEIVNIYYALNTDANHYSSGNIFNDDVKNPRAKLMEMICKSSRWARMPNIQAMKQAEPYEAIGLNYLIQCDPTLLDDQLVVQQIFTTPEYFNVIGSMRNIMTRVPEFFDNQSSNVTFWSAMIGLEYAHIGSDFVVDENSPFIFRADDPCANFVSRGPEIQEAVLSHVTHGISELIDYSTGACVSGSMISAALQYLKRPNMVTLERNYPRIFTKLMIDGKVYTYDPKNKELNAKATKVYTSLRNCLRSIDRGYLLFDVRLEDDIVTLKVFLPDSPPKLVENTLFKLFVEEMINGNIFHTFTFKMTPGCDMDVPVCNDVGEVDGRMVFDLMTKLQKIYPSVALRVITKNRTSPLYQITSDDLMDYLNGFRNIEVYPSLSGKQQIVSYHLNPVRAWKGNLPGIYMTASAVYSHSHNDITHHHYFAGKSSPYHTIDKYWARGFSLFLDGYAYLREKVDMDDPTHDISELKNDHQFALIGDFNVLSFLLFKNGTHSENLESYFSPRTCPLRGLSPHRENYYVPYPCSSSSARSWALYRMARKNRSIVFGEDEIHEGALDPKVSPDGSC